MVSARGNLYFGDNIGCSHECIYCFARGEYYKIQNFNQIQAQKKALQLISDDLRKFSRGIVATGGLSDPYNHRERELKLTRNAIKLVNDFSLGVCILTKSNMVVRDIDILQEIKTHSRASSVKDIFQMFTFRT